MEFTYLIGAGASAQTIPVINNFARELEFFAKSISSIDIEEDKFPEEYRTDSSPIVLKGFFENDIQWLAKECKNHSSIDTFARKLFLSGRKADLIKLKTITSEFLLYQQIYNGIDKRYDAFFAALLDNSKGALALPNNIKIVSWNYDKQIEFSISQFLNHSHNSFIEDFLQLSPRKEGTAIDPSDFCLFKINGTIGGTISNNDNYIPMDIDYNFIKNNHSVDNDKKIILGMLQRYYFITQRIKYLDQHSSEQRDDYPTIMYSWENNPIFERVRQNALNTTRNTDILVIIGYSFPTFNRSIDKKFLQNMSNLKKVFIQSPKESIKGVSQRFNSLYDNSSNIEVELIENVDEFYIPYEF